MPIASVGTVKGYRGYIARRLSEQESLLAMFRHLEGRISRYLSPLRDALQDFEDDNLRQLGFYEKLSEGQSIKEVFEDLKPRLSVGENVKMIISESLSELSLGYKDEVIAKIREVGDSLEKILKEERESLSKNERVASSVTVAAVLGIFILLV